MDFEQLAVFRLGHGSHSSAEEGVCAMEAVAWLEGLEHTDSPACTCPIIAEFVRSVNDRADDEQRQRLVAYLPRLVGTVSPEHELERAQYLAWRAIVVFAPSALESAGLPDEAAKLRALPEHDWAAARAAAGAAAEAAWVAARAAAEAAGAAAEAAGAAARAAAWAAAGAAARAAWMDDCLETLDGVLAIGPQSPGFSKPVETQVAAYRELMGAHQ